MCRRTNNVTIAQFILSAYIDLVPFSCVVKVKWVRRFETLLVLHNMSQKCIVISRGYISVGEFFAVTDIDNALELIDSSVST